MSSESSLPPLCDVCQKLGLSNTNNQEVKNYPLGNWEDVNRKAHADPPCPFCAAIRSFIRQSGLASYFQYDRGEASIQWKEAGGFFLNSAGDNLAFVNEDIATSPFGSARVVQPSIDPSLIKKWITLCEDHHEDLCAPRRGVIRAPDSDVGVKVLRVIDIEDQCIVEATPSTRYFALSYVWGRTLPVVRLLQDKVDELGTKGAFKRLRDDLPKTIRDAMDMMSLIGERYLWVDSLCLIQDDGDDMQDGISHMDLVYQCAACTIMAAHGVDANAGLPGLHPGSRDVNQEIIEVLPGIKLTTTTGVYNAMGKGVHKTRGWTLQELALSHRVIVFTDHCIYYRCRTNCWSEDTIYDKFPSAVNEVLHSGGGVSFVPDNPTKPLNDFFWQLFRFATRKLTKESDMINGLTGILRFLSVSAKSGVLEGLFTSSFDISLLCWDNFPMDTKFARREGFPSWSWAGWKGIRDGYGRFCQAPDSSEWLRTQTYIVWYKRVPATASLELVWDLDSQLKYGKPEENDICYRSEVENPYGHIRDELMESRQTKPSDDDGIRTDIIRDEIAKRKYHLLQFFAYTVLVKGFANPPQETKWAMIYPILGVKGKTCGGLKFDNPSLVKGDEGPHELVLLSKMDKYDNYFNDKITFEESFYWVMLIVWIGKERVVAERRGIGILFKDRMQHVLAPGRVWKEIVLA